MNEPEAIMEAQYDYKKFAILYVDDEEKSLKSFARAFEDEFRIYTATNAQDGAKLLVENISLPPEVEAALADSSVRVGLHRDWGRAVEWVPASDRSLVWTRDVATHFVDGGLRQTGKRPRGPMPYVASLWSLGDRIILLFDRD